MEKLSKMTADPFRAFLLKLGEELKTEDLEKLKFLCKDVIPGGVLSSINKGRDLFEELEKQGQFSRQNIEGLRKLLAEIRRVDLINKLQKFIDACNPGGVKDDPEAKTFGLRVKQADFLTGRDALIEKIAQVYTAGQKPMVAVIAPPGFGKTFVATHVGHAMKDKGYNVIYVSLQQKQSCHLMCCDILKTRDPETTLSKDVIQQTKNRLKSLKEPTLLILDNAEDIQNSSCSDEFKDFVEFLGSCAEKLKIFLGSRKSISTKYFEHESINLHPLNNKESSDLLAKAGGESLKKHEAETLAIQCAGVPLLIKIAAGLVKNGYNPTKLANDLKERTYDVLTLKENEQMKFLTKSIQVFLDSLQREKLVALVQLSCFPASFTQDIVNKLFFEDDVKCSGMLSSLYASALVQLDGENYILHPLIQTFCRDDQERMKCKKEGTRAMEKFSYYYFNKLEELHIQFVSKDGCQKALKEFCSSEMNLLQALENALKCNDKKMKGSCIDAFNASINLLGKIMLPSKCLSVCGQLYIEAEKMKDKKRMSECLVSRGFRYMCDVNHGTFSQNAFDAFETALSLWRKNLFKTKQPDTEAYAHCLSKLGLCYIAKGQKENGQTADGKNDEEEGRRLINDAIPIRDRLGDKVLLAASNCDKAIAARLCNNHAQAIEIFENRCLPVYKEHLGDHPWVASLLNYMSKCHQDLGCLEKAIECTKQSLDIREKILGDHQDTARSYVRRGELFLAQENLEAALEAYRKAASIQEKVLGAHEETNKSYEAIQDILYKQYGNAFVLTQLGREEKAEEQMHMPRECLKKVNTTPQNHLPRFPKSTSQEGDAVGNIGTERDDVFGKYDNFALDYHNRVYFANMEEMMGLKYSVGAIVALNVSNVPESGATCFRIGTKYVITCKHVVDDIKSKGITMSNCYVDFNYKEEGQPSFRVDFAPNPELVSSAELDYAILELYSDGGESFPPSVTELGFNIAPSNRQLQGGECLTLIGHPRGPKKQIDVSCPIKHQKDIQEYLNKPHLVYLVQNAYNNPDCATYDVSTFFEGSSGSPGLSLDKKLLMVLHSGGIHESEGTNKRHVLEGGTLMSSVVDDVMKKIKSGVIQNLNLDDIFGGLTSSTFVHFPEPMEVD